MSNQDESPENEFREMIKKLAVYRMPYGRFKGRLLTDLPEPYLNWFYRKGFPAGELGKLMSLALEIKMNGLEYLIDELRNR